MRDAQPSSTTMCAVKYKQFDVECPDFRSF